MAITILLAWFDRSTAVTLQRCCRSAGITIHFFSHAGIAALPRYLALLIALIMLLFASQTAQGGPSVILPALLITGLLVAASQAFVPKNTDEN